MNHPVNHYNGYSAFFFRAIFECPAHREAEQAERLKRHGYRILKTEFMKVYVAGGPGMPVDLIADAYEDEQSPEKALEWAYVEKHAEGHSKEYLMRVKKLWKSAA